MPQKTNKVLVACHKCGKPFFLAHYFFIRNERRFCSPECFRAVRYGHKCDYRPCSNPEHLFLGTQLDNVLDCARKGRTNTEPGTRAMHKHGEQHTQAKLTEPQVREIRARAAAAKRCCARLAREYGVSNGLIIMIVKRKIWTHLE